MTTGTPALLGMEHYIYRKHGKVYVHRVGGGEPIVFPISRNAVRARCNAEVPLLQKTPLSQPWRALNFCSNPCDIGP